ncbi:hypothetical protein B9Z55_025104 [Caenorhabditis nigoni]|uniref:Uncharacterized protein n=1 Tax=Caenorhabditis nigoni TaxID=1611254 RepID=A0A2G5SXG8_9PELO|nr:hypothetical protein B9Z55_025104 [Caenorhabditis nigoni]
MEEEEPQPIIVPLRYAPWFRERNIGFEILKEIHGNYVKWKKHSIEEDVDMVSRLLNSFIVSMVFSAYAHVELPVSRTKSTSLIYMQINRRYWVDWT